MGVWVYGCVGVWVWVHVHAGCIGVWVYGCTAYLMVLEHFVHPSGLYLVTERQHVVAAHLQLLGQGQGQR